MDHSESEGHSVTEQSLKNSVYTSMVHGVHEYTLKPSSGLCVDKRGLEESLKASLRTCGTLAVPSGLLWTAQVHKGY